MDINSVGPQCKLYQKHLFIIKSKKQLSLSLFVGLMQPIVICRVIIMFFSSSLSVCYDAK